MTWQAHGRHGSTPLKTTNEHGAANTGRLNRKAKRVTRETR